MEIAITIIGVIILFGGYSFYKGYKGIPDSHLTNYRSGRGRSYTVETRVNPEYIEYLKKNDPTKLAEFIKKNSQ